jgi:hypothetical protein
MRPCKAAARLAAYLFKERHSPFGFQGTHRQRNGRLADIGHPRRGGESAFRDDQMEIPEMLQIHKYRL